MVNSSARGLGGWRIESHTQQFFFIKKDFKIISENFCDVIAFLGEKKDQTNLREITNTRNRFKPKRWVLHIVRKKKKKKKM